MRAQAWDRKA